jgi:hypothetical protein
MKRVTTKSPPGEILGRPQGGVAAEAETAVQITARYLRIPTLAPGLHRVLT